MRDSAFQFISRYFVKVQQFQHSRSFNPTPSYRFARVLIVRLITIVQGVGGGDLQLTVWIHTIKTYTIIQKSLCMTWALWQAEELRSQDSERKVCQDRFMASAVTHKAANGEYYT